MTKTQKDVLLDDEIKRKIMKADFNGYLDGVGTFILTNTQLQAELIVIATNGFQKVHSFQTYLPVQGALPCGPYSILLLGHSPHGLRAHMVTTSSHNWSTVTGPGQILSNSTEVLNSSLLRSSCSMNIDCRYDFTIVCNDGKEIPVKSQVLSSHWSYFETMLASEMAETTTRKLTMDYPSAWIEAIVRYIDCGSVCMDFETVTGVLVVAQVYILPGLLAHVMTRIKNQDMDMGQAIMAWSRANSVGNTAVTDYCIEEIRELIVNPTSSRTHSGVADDLSKEEFVDLFNSLASISNK